jgi:protein transport protein SEC61 subunit gamma-like protein
MNNMGKIRNYLSECRRVLKLTKKPDRNEFKMIVKVTGIGLLAIGLIGFIVSMIKQLIIGAF